MHVFLRILSFCVVVFIVIKFSEASVIARLLRYSVTEVTNWWYEAIIWSVKIFGAVFAPANFTDFTNPYTYVIISLICLLSYFYYQINLKPLNRVRNLGEIGYIYDAHEDKRNTANQVQRLRKVGDLPPAYPNGWYGVIESHRIPPATSKTVNMLGW